MIIATIKVKAFSVKRKEILQTIQAIIERVKQEKGCLDAIGYQDIDDDNTFCLVEKWESQRDLDNHIKYNTFSALLGTKILLSEPMEINFMVVSYKAGVEVVEALRGQSIQT